jgi:hypothetical protein
MAKLTGPRQIVRMSSKDEDRPAALDRLERSVAEIRARANAAVRRLITDPTAEEKARLRPISDRWLREVLFPLPYRIADVRELLGNEFFFSDLCAVSLSTLRNAMKNPLRTRRTKLTAKTLLEHADRFPEALEEALEDEHANYGPARAARHELELLFGNIKSASLSRGRDDRTFLAVERLRREKSVSKAKAFAEIATEEKRSVDAVKQAYHRVLRRRLALK